MYNDYIKFINYEKPMKKFISKNGVIVNMDNVCSAYYDSVNREFRIYFLKDSRYFQCSDDEYKAIVNFLKSKDETYLEL